MNGSMVSRGVVLMLLSNVAFCGMAYLVRDAGVDARISVFFRFVVGLGILGSGAMMGLFSLRFVSRQALFFRGLFGGTATYLYFQSITSIGMGKGSLISYTYPIFATIFTATTGTEKMTARKMLWVMVAFIGMVLLMGERVGGSFVPSRGEALALLGAVLSGLAVAFVKKLHETDSTYAIFFAQCMGGFWIMILPASCAGGIGSLHAGGVLIGVGLLAAAGQLLMTESYRTVSVTTGSLLSMLTPVLSTMVGVVVLKEAVSIQTIIGGTIVLASCVAILRIKERS